MLPRWLLPAFIVVSRLPAAGTEAVSVVDPPRQSVSAVGETLTVHCARSCSGKKVRGRAKARKT